MKMADITTYFKALFEEKILVAISAIAITIYNFLFPTSEYKLAAIAVFGVMILDIFTRLFAIARCEGGLKKAFKNKKIRSAAFAKGTIDKLVVFGVMLCICGFAYNLTIVSGIAIWFTQIVFTLMFLRDVLSILENLTEAGIDVGLLKHVIKKKMTEYCDEEEVEKLTKKREAEKKAECKAEDETGPGQNK